MENVPRAETTRRLGHVSGELASRPHAAQDLLAAEGPAESRGHVTGGNAQLGKPAQARADAFDGYSQALERVRQIGRRSRPRAQVARIAEDASNSHAIEAQRVPDVDLRSDIHREHGSIARCHASSDQAVTWPVTNPRRHQLITRHP